MAVISPLPDSVLRRSKVIETEWRHACRMVDEGEVQS
jgi:hypothetical protein